MSEQQPGDLTPIQQAVYDIADALDNPVDSHGNTYDMRYLKPALAYHLARAGLGVVEGQAVIKRREYSNGYVEWVGLDEPDLPPDPLAGVTLADLANATPEQREAAIRRLQAGSGPVADPDDAIPWRVRTNIQIDEESLK